MAAQLGQFLDDMARLGWEWGERDCLLWLGLWSERVTGIDGGEPWRGRYKTALGCMRTLNKSGGMEGCIERGASLAGLSLGQPEVGAVGLVPALTPRGPDIVGGIFTGTRWAVLTRKGVLSMRCEPIRAWNLPDGRSGGVDRGESSRVCRERGLRGCNVGGGVDRNSGGNL